MKREGLFTCESVSAGHPDKLCDAVSDAILDACLAEDPMSHVACETTANKDTIRVFGEITTSATPDYDAIVRKVVANIGYDDISKSFDWKTCNVIVDINSQSPDIAMGVNNKDNKSMGAGDQGMMFGYACRETPQFMPYALMKSHELLRRLDFIRQTSGSGILYPDAKAQITVDYCNGVLTNINSIVVSSQHSADVSVDDVFAFIEKDVITPVFERDELFLSSPMVQFYCNPTGRFVIGGPLGDAGLTGRKIIVDTYGGYAPHGGGAFSGKDPSKVDRSGAYLARWIAKNIVAAGITSECTVQLAYVIGVADPVSFCISGIENPKLMHNCIDKVRSLVDLRPYAIIERFGLLNPIYHNVSAYGHFGNEAMPWENLDLASQL